jgi:hypothetical protein
VGAVAGREPWVVGAKTWESVRGRLAISRPAPHVILAIYEGHLTVDMVPFFEASVAPALETGIRQHLFIDLEHISGYDSEYRRAITKWGVRTQRYFEQTRFLVRSRIVAIGVAVSNLSSGGFLEATTKRSEFEAALQTAMRRDEVGPP